MYFLVAGLNGLRWVGFLHASGGNKWVDATTATRWHTMANENSIDEHLPFDSSERSEEELIDHLFGLKAGAAGERNDETKSPAWQRGWADAQK